MVRRSVSRIKINIYFQENVLEALRRLADLRGTTYSELIREACHEFVIREGGKILQDNIALKEMTK